MLANSEDPDRTPQNATSDLGPHCLSMSRLMYECVNPKTPCILNMGHEAHNAASDQDRHGFSYSNFYQTLKK